MRGDVDRIRQLRAQRAATRCAEVRNRAEFAGVPTATIPVRYCRCSFFDSGTRAARVSLTHRAFATGCALIFAQRISPRANRTHPRRQDYQPIPIDFFNDQISSSNSNLNDLHRCGPGPNTGTDRLRLRLRCCRSARPSPRPHRNRETATTAGERSANPVGKGEPCWKSTASGSRRFTGRISFTRRE